MATSTVSLPALFADPDALATAPDLRYGDSVCAAPHSMDEIVGYVVRQTVEGGVVLPSGVPHRPGRDVAVVPNAKQYPLAVAIFNGIRAKAGSWAVADHLFECGCRV